MTISDAIKTREYDKFRGESKETTKTAVVIEDSDTNEFETITNSVGITAIEIELPSADEFIIFHQTEDAVVHFSSNSTVSASDPSMVAGDVLRITGREDFLIYMISASGTVPVFAMSTVKG